MRFTSPTLAALCLFFSVSSAAVLGESELEARGGNGGGNYDNGGYGNGGYGNGGYGNGGYGNGGHGNDGGHGNGGYGNGGHGNHGNNGGHYNSPCFPFIFDKSCVRGRCNGNSHKCELGFSIDPIRLCCVHQGYGNGGYGNGNGGYGGGHGGHGGGYNNGY
ncbi:hypothetical protein DFH08DRAFT_968750 [Mycena albidolilacea]|uniref:Uncharacterized protein n=1 Tax=Mycena albidolilacea TaxID=1033008 RepID=A0AAD6ZJY7_9AGAR|nr:hypothetical protein DFH08DRAFT_968750 [Mycena albidolilacea]